MREKANNSRDLPHFLGRLSIPDPPLLYVSPVNSLKIKEKTVKEDGRIMNFSRYFKVWMALVNRLFIINQKCWISVKQNAIAPLTMRSYNENNSMYALA